jgi:hypothetical protein
MAWRRTSPRVSDFTSSRVRIPVVPVDVALPLSVVVLAPLLLLPETLGGTTSAGMVERGVLTVEPLLSGVIVPVPTPLAPAPPPDCAIEAPQSASVAAAAEAIFWKEVIARLLRLEVETSRSARREGLFRVMSQLDAVLTIDSPSGGEPGN